MAPVPVRTEKRLRQSRQRRALQVLCAAPVWTFDGEPQRGHGGMPSGQRVSQNQRSENLGLVVGEHSELEIK